VFVAVAKAKLTTGKPNAYVEGFVDDQICLKTNTVSRSKNPVWNFVVKT